MNIKFKFLRLVLASCVGSLIWAGCAKPRYSAVEIDPKSIEATPVDMTKRRPDTHPELRTGLWQVTYQGLSTRPDVVNPLVFESTVYQNLDAPPGTVDSTYLITYRPEAINVALSGEAPQGIIAEAAAAEFPVRVVREVRPRSWTDRLFHNKRILDRIRAEEVAPAR